MKKIIVALLMLSCLILFACGQKVQEEEAQEDYKPPEVVDGAVQIGRKEDLARNNTPTTNGYNEDKGGSIIDFCLYSSAKAVPLHYEVLNEKILDGYVSDHRGIYVEAALIT